MNMATDGPAPPVIETRQLTKRYGSFAALEDCSLRVEHGEVLGLLGPNGAGKTTLIRLLLAFLRPTSGEARIGGLDCTRDSLAIRARTAYLPGEARMFRSLRGGEVLQFFADLRSVDVTRARRIAERLELDLRPRVSTMSTGMRQKLALAATMAAGTRLIILDEPTSNLDPTARAVVLELVREARQAGSTILFSSHVMSEVEESCDRVIILRRGHVVHTQVIHELRQQHRITARVGGELPPAPAHLAPHVQVSLDAQGLVRLDASGPLAPVLAWLATVDLQEVRIDPGSLRAVYDRFHGEQRQAAGATTA